MKNAESTNRLTEAGNLKGRNKILHQNHYAHHHITTPPPPQREQMQQNHKMMPAPGTAKQQRPTFTEMRQVAWGSNLDQCSANLAKSSSVMKSSDSSFAVSKPSRITPMNRFRNTKVIKNVKLYGRWGGGGATIPMRAQP